MQSVSLGRRSGQELGMKKQSLLLCRMLSQQVDILSLSFCLCHGMTKR